MPLGDQFDWALNSGTTGTLKTGPTEDHTGYKGKIIIPVLLLLLLLFLFCFCFVFVLIFFSAKYAFIYSLYVFIFFSYAIGAVCDFFSGDNCCIKCLILNLIGIETSLCNLSGVLRPVVYYFSCGRLLIL